MEKFLEFWSHHNATIIEGLVALIMVSVIYLAYRSFFGAKNSKMSDDGVTVGNVDTGHIEKTLQKILEQQSSSKELLEKGITFTATPGDGHAAPAGTGAPPPEMIQELATLKKSLEEKEKQVAQLQEKVTQAAAGAGASAEGAAAAAAAGLAEKEREDFEAKIKELEARLAEYEIISEDIADLSFYKEENVRLTKELEALKGGAGAPPAAPAAAAPADSTPAPAAAAAAPAAAAPAPAEPPPLEVEVPAAPVASAEAENAIDDSLMKEFEAAVQGQKTGTLENENLMDQFENFSKKS